MADALGVLTSLTVILLIGLIVSIISSKLKIPDILLLIASGILIGSVPYKGAYLFEFPTIFLTSISILALAIIIFDSTSKLKIREFDTFSFRAFKLAMIFLLLNLVFISVATKYLFDVPLIMGILFASIMMGTAPEITLSMLSGTTQKTIEILKLESIINTPLTVLFPFLIIDLTNQVEFKVISTIIDQIGPFVAKFAAGIGSGMLVGIILFKLIKKRVSKSYVPLVVIVSALLSYVLAENIGGSGVLAVTTLGLFVGNISKKHKLEELFTFESLLAKALFIIVFVLIGIIIKIPLNKKFFVSAGILFLIYMLVRWVSIELSFRKKETDLGFKQKIFMTLNMPKGIAVAVVAFSLSTYRLEGIKTILDLTLLFMLATIVLSSVSMFFAKPLIGQEAASQK